MNPDGRELLIGAAWAALAAMTALGAASAWCEWRRLHRARETRREPDTRRRVAWRLALALSALSVVCADVVRLRAEVSLIDGRIDPDPSGVIVIAVRWLAVLVVAAAFVPWARGTFRRRGPGR